MDYKKNLKQMSDFFLNKKFQNILVIILFLGILFLGTYLRLYPIKNLTDATTNDYLPIDLDASYFLRISETLVENNGVLPAVDNMRYPTLNATWSQEILPQSTILIHKIIQVFSPDSTLRFANIINPPIFFLLSIIVFFFLIFVLTKNKWISLLSSGFLSLMPPFLFRTLAGLSDHEAIGIFGFFLALLSFAIGLIYLDKKKTSLAKSGIFGLIAGFFTMFSIACWGGGAKFIFMILPLSFIIFWLIKKEKSYENSVLFYSLWIVGTILTTSLFGYSLVEIIKSYMIVPVGILTFFTLGFILIEFILIKLKIFEKKYSEYIGIISLVITLILGGIFYQVFIGHLFSLIHELFDKIIYPFGTGRVGLTVAENKQPYLTDLTAQIGNLFFCLFLFGCYIIGFKLSEGIKVKKLKYLFNFGFIIFVSGILFSRISATSIFNGENFISKLFFFITFLIFAAISVYTYWKSEWTIEAKWIFIAAWMIPMLLSVRSAVRVFFALMPFVCFVITLSFFELWGFAKNSKEETLRILSYILILTLVISSIFVLVNFYKADVIQAKYQSPVANADWQKAMAWTRNNTSENDLFLHWWDYGYIIQTFGERPTVTDGGHMNAYWDHLIARYVLTTPTPEIAKSYMKSLNVSYFLIDPTDIGKYTAYSSIADDKEMSDRYSWLMTFVSDTKNTQETRDSTIRIYQGGTYLDSDLFLEEGNNSVFLPKNKAAIIGIIITSKNNSYAQPIGVYYYKDKQYRAPIRYLFVGGELADFKSGVNSTVYIYPNVYDSGNGLQFDLTGAAMYLSEKTKDSLVAKLYLMDDPNKEYPELDLVVNEGVYPFSFYYNGFYGPLKIWKVNKNEMSNIVAHEEFLKTEGEFGEFDNLTFKN